MTYTYYHEVFEIVCDTLDPSRWCKGVTGIKGSLCILGMIQELSPGQAHLIYNRLWEIAQMLIDIDHIPECSNLTEFNDHPKTEFEHIKSLMLFATVLEMLQLNKI